jgi:hypothetical protein
MNSYFYVHSVYSPKLCVSIKLRTQSLQTTPATRSHTNLTAPKPFHSDQPQQRSTHQKVVTQA